MAGYTITTKVNDKGAGTVTCATNFKSLSLKAEATDATFKGGATMDGVKLTVSKSKAYSFSYCPGNQAISAEFMNNTGELVDGRDVSLKYAADLSRDSATLEAGMKANDTNSVSAKFDLKKRNLSSVKVVNTMVDNTTLTLTANVPNQSAEVKAAYRLSDDTTVEGSYNTASQDASLALKQKTKGVPVTLTLKMGQKGKPSLTGEASWSV